MTVLRPNAAAKTLSQLAFRVTVEQGPHLDRMTRISTDHIHCTE
jgi:hypothetical protein